MTVHLRYVLVQSAPQWRKLAELAGVALNDKLLGFSQRQVELKLRHCIKQEQNSMDCVLWEVFRLAIDVEIYNFLAEDLYEVRHDSLVRARLQHAKGDQNLSL